MYMYSEAQETDKSDRATVEDHSGNKPSGFIVFISSVICDICNDHSAVLYVFLIIK